MIGWQNSARQTSALRFRSQVISGVRVKSLSIYADTLLCFTHALISCAGKFK